MAGGSTGNSLETTVIQLAADALGADIDDVATIQGDTAVTPFGAGTGGSRSGSMTAGAVGETAAILRAKLTALAAHKLEAAEADIELANSRAGVRGDPDAPSVSFAELADIAYFQPYALPPGMPAGLEASGRYAPSIPMLWATATHVCTCEVDVTTGAVKLLRYIVGEDCGHMINPNVVEGQIAGGVVQGIGGALLEELAYDADGNPVATTFMDYLLPTAAEVPLIEYGHVEDAPSPNPGGYKGVGEGGAIGAPPAVVNAVADALAPFGVTITRTPAHPGVHRRADRGRPAREARAVRVPRAGRRQGGRRAAGRTRRRRQADRGRAEPGPAARAPAGILRAPHRPAQGVRPARDRGPRRVVCAAIRPGWYPTGPGSAETVWIGAGTTEAAIGRSPLVGGEGPAAGAGHPADRPLPDPQPRHDRRFARARRRGRRVPGGGAGPRRGHRDAVAARPARHPRGRVLHRHLEHRAGTG